MSRLVRWKVLLVFVVVVSTWSLMLWSYAATMSQPEATEAAPAHYVTVQQNLQAIHLGLLTYANDNRGYLPPRLSMLYPDYISDPAVFWSPGDSDPVPTTIDNDEPDQPNSAQVSFAYAGAGHREYDVPLTIVHDNSLSNNSSMGVFLLSSEDGICYYPIKMAFLPFIQTAKNNLQQLGAALNAFADDNEGHYPDALSMLYPVYISDPAVFWNPGDDLPGDPPEPTTIDNDVPDAADSAQISFAYYGTGRTSDGDPNTILLQDNSPSNNRGAIVNLLLASGLVRTCVLETPDYDPQIARSISGQNLSSILRACYTYANENEDAFPTDLSMLYRTRIYDPTLFWHPGDTDPRPLYIDNNLPDAWNSAQISYAYYDDPALSTEVPSGSIICQDRSMTHNGGLGVNIATADSRVGYYVPSDRSVPWTPQVYTNLAEINAALHAYADSNGGVFPDQLSMLYPTHIDDPAIFWNPGDDDPAPTTIDNDGRNQDNSAQVSFEYLAAGYPADGDPGLILVQDNSMHNNGGETVNILAGDGSVALYAPEESTCLPGWHCKAQASAKRTVAAAHLSTIGWALAVYANSSGGMAPPHLSMLMPKYIDRPRSFWNPGDSDPWPLMIDNDEPDAPNSTQISFDYLAADQDLWSLPYDAILAQDNTPDNNGGQSRLVLFADFHVEVVLECNDPFADMDHDGDVDQADFGHFQECLSYAQGYQFVPLDCECFDRPETASQSHGDGDIDQDDYDAFEACASGPAIPADPACDDL